MLLLLTDKDRAQEFGKRLYERASSNFSSERMAQDYIDIYKRILAGGIEDEQGNLPRG
jgi:glycosyltransferase involved in cell wall biosynthesis